MVVQRGEIWWTTLPQPIGSEPGYRRPMLVIQAEPFNRSAIGTVICAVITANLRLAGAPGNVRIDPRESGLPKTSVVNVSQVLTVDKRFLTKRIQALSARTMQEVDTGLRLAMGL